MPYRDQSRPALRKGEKFTEELHKSFSNVDFQYEYLNGLDLHPNSELTRKLVDEVMERVHDSNRMMDRMRPEWQKMDWTLTSYMPADDAEKLEQNKDVRKPIAVVLPMTFASLETFMTYMTEAFFALPPTHRYGGPGSKDRLVNAAKIERLMAVQSVQFKERLALSTMIRDALAYGQGTVAPQWRKRRANATISQEVTELMAAVLQETIPDIQAEDVLRFTEEQVVYEGQELRNMDPYYVINDPHTPLSKFQESEYSGYMWQGGAMDLLRREADLEEGFFNARYARMLAEQGNGLSGEFWVKDKTGRMDKYGMTRPEDTSRRTSTLLQHMTLCWDIIPKEFGLSDKETPEKWLVTVTGDRIITQLGPLSNDHKMFPLAKCFPNDSGYDIAPVSHLATSLGLQRVGDFYLNSDIDNVRKSLNNMFIFDPTKLETEDILNPGPGKLIRLKQAAYGEMKIDQYFKQLDVRDTTARHASNAMLMIDLLRQTNGTVDITMGDLSNMPERPTRLGIQAAQQGGLSRLKYIASNISWQAMFDIAFQGAFNTVQYMSQDRQISILGRYEEYLRAEYNVPSDQNSATVSPDELTTDFDVEPRDGTLPGLDDIEAMQQVVGLGMQIPEVALSVAASLDFQRMYLQLARKTGFEDVHEFIKTQQPQQGALGVMPDQQVQNEVQQGNLVPVAGVAA
jgi:hypothetical protein